MTLKTTTHPRSASLMALACLAIVGASGCALRTGVGVGAEDEQAVSSQESALTRGSGGPRLGYTCDKGTCTCDKAIENDCENMSAVCTDASIDALIRCINGWLTTGCTCPQALVAQPTKPLSALPTRGGVLSRQ